MLTQISIAIDEDIHERQKEHTESSRRRVTLFQDAPEEAYKRGLYRVRNNLGAFSKGSKIRNSEATVGVISQYRFVEHLFDLGRTGKFEPPLVRFS